MDSGLQEFEKGHLAFQKIKLNQSKNRTEQISVVYQLDNLLTYPAVKRRVEEGTLYLHG